MTCPSCGEASDPGARFCSSCGGPLVTVGDERRVLTVLFADIVGYTTLAEHLDPERVKNLVDTWFERLVADINEFGGRVDNIVGDAIVALFGAPVAHEDDAERAVRAALRMQQTIATMAAEGPAKDRSGIRLRIGVNTGEVLVGSLRAGGSATAMGDVVNTASRLQTSAAPGEVIVGGATHLATRELIRYEPRGLLAAKGREERVEVWSAVETLLPPGSRPTRRRVPLVGRDDEMALLRNVVDSSVANSRALLVLLVGDAGVGKTRLASELAAWAAAEHGSLTVEGRCVPYGEANVWWPVAEALRQACFVDDAMAPTEMRDRTADRVREALSGSGIAADVDRVTNGLLHLMGSDGERRDIDPSNAREEAIRSLATFVEASAQRQPVVIQLSDVHWADPMVVELVDALLERLARCPLVVVCTARQTIREQWNPPPGRHNTLVVNLDPLAAEAAGDLLDSLAGVAPPTELRDALVTRSGGNPFFLEELVALLGDCGADDDAHQLPDTLRGLVAARLDSLGPDERAVLTDAAVIGRRSAIVHLREMADGLGRNIDVDSVVAELVAKELFEVHDGMWSFRSDLVREVAYATLTKLDRARRHAGIASWIEHHSPGDTSDAKVDSLAHHYGVAAELISELGSSADVPERVRERAIHWIGIAADRASHGEVLPVAERLYTQALELVGQQPSTERLAFLLGRGHVRAAGWDIGGAREDATAARREAAAVGDAGSEARSLLQLGDTAQKAGDTDTAVATLQDAAERFDALGDDQGRGEALRLEGMAELFRGATGPAERAVQAARDAFVRAGSRSGEAWALQNLAWISFTTGRADEAEARLQRSVATFSEIGDPVGSAWALGLLAFVKFQQGERGEAELLGQAILDEARARGDRWATGMMLVLLSSIELWKGRTDAAAMTASEASEIFDDIGDPYGRTQAITPRARALVMAGRVDEGLAAFAEALAAAATMPGVEASALARGALAGAHVQLGDPDAADASGAFETPLMSQGMPDNELLVTRALARLQQGRLDEARTLLDDAIGVQGGPRPFARSAMALAAAVDGRLDDALAHCEAVPVHPAHTYLDLAVAEMAAGLALAGRGDGEQACRWLDQAQGRLDATQDRLGQALVRLARSVALEALRDPTAADVAAEASDRLACMGVPATGWSTLFALAAAAGARS